MWRSRLAVCVMESCGALAYPLAAVPVGSCSSSYAINLTVDLSPELTNRDDNLLIELRRGVVGNSKIVDTKHFVGHNGTVTFSDICGGSYFIDIGNGSKVAVGPVHVFEDNQHIHSTIRVTYSNGNVGTMSRRGL
jgi:hypothetical protein